MTLRTKLLIAAACVCAAASLEARASAQPSPAVVASPSPRPSAVLDPCGSILSIVNRPTFGTGVCTVRTGHFDLESGYTNTVTGGPGGGNVASYPQWLMRLGTADPHLDVEVGAPSFSLERSDGTSSSGWGDLSLGAKYELGYDAKADWGANAIVTLPTGIHGFTAGNAQFTGNFNWGYTLDAEFALSGTLGVNAFSVDNPAGRPESYFAFTPTLEISAALPGGPSQIDAEYAYVSSEGPNLGSRSWIDLVYQRDFGAHVQVDAEYGFSSAGIGGQPQRYVGAGIAFMN